ncbi:transcription termination/antitermination factor NusG [Fusobacterium necrophorum]|uniref:Transcription termination/antitermination protein NusG n=2 Tax=Fusobacterium necrophorum TaxID=859 RepID=A0AB73BW18_9FUSO|nr:transcription termination/antitermination protein NusG [Fusobacterium necrophorum]AYZ73366.1 transcription termination/antitermination factor NusG [Fusobacterium necrophorum]AZW08637.1 transcription termination/antitermination factor NusG [Fusobacterium necrophorum subsp. necrophorum]KDE63018.1 transcription antitermination protein NusG [Fusobacterium necrophorum BL]KDE65207.1 transcription antitermination protein NusG [Fusobacterium necrophorum BFTR-1]KDE67525.1 transcription antiterminati
MTKTEVKRWFMIHTYSGYEKKVKTDLEQKIETLGMKEIVSKILVPEEKSTEIVRGKEKVVFRKIFPGYVMLEMTAVREESDEGINYKVDSDAWYVVRNTNGVTGFVGVGSDPIPMEEHEVENVFRVIGYEQEVREFHKADFQIGDYVKVLEGGFVNKEGKVAEMDYEQGKVKIMIDIFGRMTPVEVSFSSVEKM